MQSFTSQSPGINVVARRSVSPSPPPPFQCLIFYTCPRELLIFLIFINVGFYFFSAIHGLVACGGEDGAVECFDMRQKSHVGRISILASTNDVDQVSTIDCCSLLQVLSKKLVFLLTIYHTIPCRKLQH